MIFKSILGTKRVIISAMFLAFMPVFISCAFAAIDTDGDGVTDSSDNCTLTPNPLQRDTDADGYGNICDADLNQCHKLDSRYLAKFSI